LTELLKLVKLQSGVYFYHTRTEVSFILEELCYFFFFLFKVDWKKARNFCLKNGMDLAILETAEEMKKVADAAPKNNGESSL